MPPTKKTAPHDAALAKVNDLDEQEQAARSNRDKARGHLADLQNRNQSGDPTVTGSDLMFARADLEAAEGLADHAARVLADARTDAAALQAEATASEVRDRLSNYDRDAVRIAAETAISEAVKAVRQTIADRDAGSDAIGQQLADGGVPPGRWVNGIRYEHVRTGGVSTIRTRGSDDVRYTGKVIPGQFNVAVQTPEGEAAWLSGEGLERNSGKVMDEILANAWESVRSRG